MRNPVVVSLVLFALLPVDRQARADAGAPRWSIGRHHGVMAVMRDGKPVVLNILYDNDSGMERYSGVLSQGIAKEAGLSTHMLHVHFDWAQAIRDAQQAAASPGKSEATGRLSGLDKETLSRFAKISAADPDGLFLVRLAFWAPQSWRETHRDEIYQDEKGNIPDNVYPPVSYASDLYFRYARQGLAHIVNILEQSEFGPRIVGYHPMTGYSGEWNQGSTSPSRIADYSPVNQAAFRKHLLDRFQSLENINRAFGKAFPAEADLGVPAEAEFVGGEGDEYVHRPEEMLFAKEYLRFASDLLADRLLACCKTIKDIAPGKLVGASYAYWFGPGQGGVRGLMTQPHLSFHKVASSPVFDYFLSPPDYWLCGPNSPAKTHTLLGSVDLHDKVYLAESDHPTHLVLHMDTIRAVPLIHTFRLQNDGTRSLTQLYRDSAKNASEPGADLDARYAVDFGKNYRDFLVQQERLGGPTNITASPFVPSTMQESIANLWRLGLQAISGQVGGIWWWDMEGCLRKATGGVSYNHPTILANMRRMSELFARAPALDRTSRAEVLVVYSEDAIPCFKAGARKWSGLLGMLMANLKPLGECGLPYTDVYLADLPRLRSLEQYRLVIFANAQYVSQEHRDWIDRNLKRDGRVLLWTYGSGYFDDRGCSVERMERLTGLEFSREDYADRLACRLAAAGNPLARGLADGDVLGESVEALSFEKGKRREPDEVRPQFVCRDPRAEILGVNLTGGDPVFAAGRMSGWTSVYLPGGPIPAALYRNLAGLAGANVYCETGDIQVWACRDIIGLYAFASANGPRIIRLPADIRALRDMLTGEVRPATNQQIELSCRGAQTWIYEVQR